MQPARDVFAVIFMMLSFYCIQFNAHIHNSNNLFHFGDSNICHIFSVSVLSVSFYFVLCLCCGRKQKVPK